MQRQEAGPSVVLYPPIDDDEDDLSSGESASSDLSSRRSICSNREGALAHDDITSSDRRRRRDGEESAAPAPPVLTEVTKSRSGVVQSASLEAAGGSNQRTEPGDGVARYMSQDLATKFEALKRRKANGDAIQECHVAIAEEALGMASAEIARMQRACAELEGRLGGDPHQPQPLPAPPQRRIRNPDGRDPGPRAGRRPHGDNNEEGFPVQLPRVIVVTSSEHSRSSSLDANDVGPDLDDHLHDLLDHGNHGDDPSGRESRSDP